MFAYLRSSLFFLVLLTFPFTVLAAELTTWQIIPNESHLTFTGTQNGAPVTGEFKKFSGEIKFSLDNLADSKVKIIVDIDSIHTSYGEINDTLIMPEWFDVKRFPQAVFEANQFSKLGDKQFQAKGTVTIKGKAQSIVLNFSQIGNMTDQAAVKGNTVLRRMAFGLGEGDWADTSTIKNEVKVNFELKVKK